MLNTETVIEDMVDAYCGETATARQKHLHREALRGLVRLAKSEQMAEIKTNVDKLTGAIALRATKRRSKAILPAQGHPANPKPGQEHVELNRD